MMGAVWFFNHQPPTPATTVQAAPSLPATPGDELLHLRQENARLNAEADRLRETVLTLQQVGSAHRRVAGETAAAAAAIVTPTALDLEIQAIRNDPAALDALARSVEDGQRALLRVWKTPQLSEANRAAAERHLGMMLDRLATELEHVVEAEVETPVVTVPESPVVPEPAE